MPDNPLTSLYPQPMQAQPSSGLLSGDPTKIIGLVGQLNQNALFQQIYDARKKLGEAYKGAIREDGTVDNPALMRGVAGAGFLAPDAVTAAQSQEGQRIANTTAQFQQLATQNKFVLDGLGTLADMPHPTMDAVRNFVVSAARNTGVPSSIYNSWVNSLPKDEKGLRSALVTARNMAIGPAGTAGPVPGAPDASGAPTAITQGQFGYESAGAGGGAPMSPNSVKTQSFRPPGIATGLPPGVGEAASATGQGSGSLLAHDQARGTTFRREVYPLEQAIPALEKLGKTGSGPGTTEVNNIKSFLQSVGVPGIDVEKIKNFDEASKYLTDFVNQTGSSGTNDKLAAAFAGNPSTKISNAAAIDVAKSALALRRMDHAKLLEFQRTGLPETKYAAWASQWQTKQDPRAFGVDLMKPDQVKKIVDGLKGPERAKFIESLRSAHGFGLVTPRAE